MHNIAMLAVLVLLCSCVSAQRITVGENDCLKIHVPQICLNNDWNIFVPVVDGIVDGKGVILHHKLLHIDEFIGVMGYVKFENDLVDIQLIVRRKNDLNSLASAFKYNGKYRL